MEQRTNVGYVITDSVHIGDTEFVIGQSENDPARFVTWACDNGDYYYWGHYLTSREDAPHYSYLLRLNPNKGEYNIYCYCYIRQWLDRHMRQAEKGIRFITPDYKEVFRIPDGDRIRMTLPSGETLEQTCRYIDETHLEVGNNLYHICEFAERMQRNGVKTIPLRSSLPEKCFSVLESTGEMIVITKGEKGYTPTGIFPQDASPREGVTAANAAKGVTKAQEAAMVAGSMFGWETPAADPKNYDEQGVPIRPKAKDRDER